LEQSLSMKKCRMIGFPDHPAFHDSGKNMSASLTRITRKVSRTFDLNLTAMLDPYSVLYMTIN